MPDTAHSAVGPAAHAKASQVVFSAGLFSDGSPAQAFSSRHVSNEKVAKRKSTTGSATPLMISKGIAADGAQGKKARAPPTGATAANNSGAAHARRYTMAPPLENPVA